MESREQNKVIAFDTLFSTNHIQMLKIMLPYLDAGMQRSLAIYIKLKELSFTLTFYKENPRPFCGCLAKDEPPDLGKLCRELLPYCTENERKQLVQIEQLFKNREMYREMAEAMELMKDFMPGEGNPFEDLFEGFGQSGTEKAAQSDDSASENCDGDGNAFDMKQMLRSMLSPEQQELFDLLGGNHHEHGMDEG